MKEASEIIAALPHRFPFLMVDRVLEIEPGKKAVAVKTITADGFFCGRRGTMTDLLLVEAMAQVGALAAAPQAEGSPEGELMPGFLAGLGDVRFLKSPNAGDVATLTLDFQARLGGLVRFKGVAEIGGEKAAEAILTFSVPVPI
jgi:3-hydroxyacyl-[acyl-carrier-protein] dehydratase